MHQRKFGIYDIIRSKRPYLGEPAYRLVDRDSYGFYADAIGGRFNVGRTHLAFAVLDSPDDAQGDGPYVPCPSYMVAWLLLVRWAYCVACSIARRMRQPR